MSQHVQKEHPKDSFQLEFGMGMNKRFDHWAIHKSSFTTATEEKTEEKILLE